MKFLVTLLLLLQQHASCQALDGLDQALSDSLGHPSVGIISSPDSGAAGEADKAASPTRGSSTQAGVTVRAAPTAAGRPPAPAPDADAVCTVPTLGDWALQRFSGRVCALHPDDDSGGAAPLQEPLAAAPPVIPALNASGAQPSTEVGPPPEAAAEEVPEDEERQNFAAAKDGAKIVAANKEAKKAASLLDDDGDTFLKNECKADKKWVLIELSQMIKVDTIKVTTRAKQCAALASLALRPLLSKNSPAQVSCNGLTLSC